MIGMIRFNFRGAAAEAVLADDGCWTCCAVPCLVRPLEVLFSPRWEGGPAGRRHVEGAARWLKGGVVFGADGPIADMAQQSDRGVPAEVVDRPCRHATARPTKPFDRLTVRAAAKICRVGSGMIDLWVETAAWPLPRRDGGAVPEFSLSEVKGWLATGSWPAGAHFRAQSD
jgi:hypothetical protein